MTVRSELARNRWVQRLIACVVLAGLNFLCIILVHASWAVAAPPTVAIDSAGLWCVAMGVRTEWARVGAAMAEEARVAAESAKLRQLHAPDATAGQCPVCGMDDLAYWRQLDEWSLREGAERHVQPYGKREAHRFCKELVPYVPTAEEKAAEHHRCEHRAGRRDSKCDWCFAEDRRWEREEAQRSFERSWPELMESAAAGDRQIRLTRQADPRFRHWLINEGAPTRHMDILTVESCEKARDGHGWTAILAEPLRHGLHAITSYGRNIETHGRRMMPLESERLWNREAGRPYTRTELGLCDCGYPVTSGKLRASVAVDWQRLGEEFDREHGWMWPGTEGWRK